MMPLALEAGTQLSTVITAEMLQGVLNEMLGVLPVCIPVMISFIGIRKGIAFVRSVLHSAQSAAALRGRGFYSYLLFFLGVIL